MRGERKTGQGNWLSGQSPAVAVENYCRLHPGGRACSGVSPSGHGRGVENICTDSSNLAQVTGAVAGHHFPFFHSKRDLGCRLSTHQPILQLQIVTGLRPSNRGEDVSTLMCWEKLCLFFFLYCFFILVS